MRTTFLLASLLAAAPFAASAATADELSYNYIEGGYAKVHVDDSFLSNPEGDGGYLRGSFSLGPQVNVFASYGSVSKGQRLDANTRADVDLKRGEIGVGYHMNMSERVDFLAELAYQRLELDAALSFQDDPSQNLNGSEDAKGGRVALGVRGKPSARTEAWLKAGYLDGGDFTGSFAGNLGGQINFTPTWGLVAEVELIEDFTTYQVGIRASF